MDEKPFWEKSAPKTKSGKKRKPKSLSVKQKAAAKRRAKAAGRPYPNLIDNAFAVKKGK
jgi:hypothetical protein